MPGMGKTATVHAVVRELKRRAESNVGDFFPTVHGTKCDDGLPTGIKSVLLRRNQRVEDPGASRGVQPTLGSNIWTRRRRRRSPGNQLDGSTQEIDKAF